MMISLVMLAENFEDRWPHPIAVEPAPIVEQVKPKREHKRHVELDICQRHGMHKVITRGGKSWRCKR